MARAVTTVHDLRPRRGHALIYTGIGAAPFMIRLVIVILSETRAVDVVVVELRFP